MALDQTLNETLQQMTASQPNKSSLTQTQLTHIILAGLSFNLIALLFLSHACIPKARPYTSKFFQLSHYNAETGRYGIGFDDYYFITFCIVALTGLRAATMEFVLAPLAKACGAGDKRKDLTRFSEQAWLIVFYCIFWPLGMVCSQ